MSDFKPSTITHVENNTPVPEIDPGTYTARIQAIYHLGTQPNNFPGAKNPTQYQVVFVYELTEESVEINGEMKPRIKSKTYTYSLSEKATLAKTIKELRGTAIAAGEVIDLTALLNTPCIISFVEGKNKKEDGVTAYLEFGSISAPMKGMVVGELRQEPRFFDFNSNYNPAMLDEEAKIIPKWLIEKIKASPEYRAASTGSSLGF